jgi:CHAT domain-containing protein/tetratricopeptide (TPR) repeat protein
MLLRYCPSLEVLAAHIDARLTARESQQVVEHLAVCESCFQIVAETVAFQDQEERERLRATPAVIPVRRPRRRWRLAAAPVAAAAVLAVVLLAPGTRQLLDRFSPFGRIRSELVSAAPATRLLVPRLAGFPYTPVSDPMRASAADEGDLDGVRAVSGQLSKKLNEERTVARLHGYGLSQLLLHRWTPAVTTLQEAVTLETGEPVAVRALAASHDAQLLSDLSAAYYARAVHESQHQDFVSALSAAERALHNDRRLTEAKFNRALAIEAICLGPEARKAWQEYLLQDDDSEWAAEARVRLQRLSVPSASQRWKGAVAGLDRSAAAGDLKAVSKIVESFPWQARMHGEEDLLAAWANAYSAGAAEADSKLAAARTIGNALVQFSGESMIADSVAAIDAAADKTALAAAHASYGQGRSLFASQRFSEARPLLEKARERMRESGSPFATVAALQVAICSFYANDYRATLALLESLDPKGTRLRYPATVGFIAWMRGLTHLILGHPNESLQAYETALSCFHRVREQDNIAAIDSRLAENREELNDLDGAWKYRYEALAILGNHGATGDLPNTLLEAGAAGLAQEQFPAALHFAEQSLEMAQALRKPSAVADAFLLRSRVRRRLGDSSGADQDLALARRNVALVHDVPQRQRMEARLSWQQAADEGAAPPSLSRLDHAVAFYRKGGNPVGLSFALLHRGNALLSKGDRNAARRDFEAGVEEIEKLTDNLRDEQLRASCSDGAAQLYDSLLGVLASDRRVDELFANMERSRARLLLDLSYRGEEAAGGTARAPIPSASEVQRRMPRDTTIVELSLLRDGRLVSLVIRPDSMTMSETPLNPFALIADVQSLAAAEERNDEEESRRILQSLSHDLIDPIRGQLVKEGNVVFVPDASLAAVPFPALLDTSTLRYLIQDYDIASAPSASMYVAGIERDRLLAAKPRLAFVAGNPQFDRTLFPRLEQLPNADRETDSVVTLQGATAIRGAQVTKQRLLDGLQHASLFHFCGHSVVNGRHPLLSGLVVAPDSGGGGSVLYAHDIMNARLTETRLVVLSACSTSNGGSGGSAGVSTIARAFLAAGVPSVVGSLWKVRDGASAELLTRFHANLRGGDSAARALRRAQTDLLQGAVPGYRSPSAWGAFQILGGTSL